jgi:two-component system sensor kinase FixL
MPFVELEVSDTGTGFAPGFDTALTTPLSTTKANGMGIGLSLCRSIAEAHGGRLSISNSVDGASVSILLPVAEEQVHDG